MHNFTEEELEVLSELHESVSALCCATAFVLQAPGMWDTFRNWLVDTASKEDPETAAILRAGVTPDSMKLSLRDADRLLMLAEGIQFANSDGQPPWFADDEGTLPFPDVE